VAVSPLHGPIGLAIARREADPGDVLEVGDSGATAELVELPVSLGALRGRSVGPRWPRESSRNRVPRRLSVILLARALLGLPAAAQAATSRSATLHEAAARRAGERALHEARDALRYGHVKTGLDVTSLLKELAVHLPALTGRERTEARRLLARPSTGASDYQTGFSAPDHTHCGAHFCIHWLDAGPNAPPVDDANNDGVPDYV